MMSNILEPINCTQCGSTIKIIVGQKFCECPNCQTQFVIKSDNNNIDLVKFEHALGRLVTQTTFLAADRRLNQYIEPDITRAQEKVDQENSALAVQLNAFNSYEKKCQDRLVLYKYLFWGSWIVPATIILLPFAQDSLFLGFLLFLLGLCCLVLPVIAHDFYSLMKEQFRQTLAGKKEKLKEFESEVEIANLKVKELLLEKEFCQKTVEAFHFATVTD